VVKIWMAKPMVTLSCKSLVGVGSPDSNDYQCIIGPSILSATMVTLKLYLCGATSPDSSSTCNRQSFIAHTT
jgi:hypothetical protein